MSASVILCLVAEYCVGFVLSCCVVFDMTCVLWPPVMFCGFFWACLCTFVGLFVHYAGLLC